MLAATYDPLGKNSNAFSQDNMVDGTTNKNYSATEKTKLAGVASGATVNDTDANLKNRANHTGTQTADTVTDGTTNKAYTATEKTKLAGIATAATANDTDANLKNRANHTGTQTADTVTDGTTNKAYTATEKTKLSGIASGATANATDAQLRRMVASSQTGAYTLLATDTNGYVPNTTGGWTLPANVMSGGDAIHLRNKSGSSQTITRGASLVLTREGFNVDTASFTLAAWGACTVVYDDTTHAYLIGGTSLT